jgi:hypothetical protein
MDNGSTITFKDDGGGPIKICAALRSGTPRTHRHPTDLTRVEFPPEIAMLHPRPHWLIVLLVYWHRWTEVL